MDAARQVEQGERPLQTWEAICAMYPDQFVCLADLVRGAAGIAAARVVGHGATHAASIDPIRAQRAAYPLIAVRYTGASPSPLVRPNPILDRDDLEVLRAPVRFTRRP